MFSTTNFTNGPNIVVTPAIPRSLSTMSNLSFKFPTKGFLFCLLELGLDRTDEEASAGCEIGAILEQAVSY